MSFFGRLILGGALGIIEDLINPSLGIPTIHTHFGKCSGLGESSEEMKKRVQAKDATGEKVEIHFKTNLNDLKKLRFSRSVIIGIEENRNEFSDEVMREVKRIYASTGRMIKEYEEQKCKKAKKD